MSGKSRTYYELTCDGCGVILHEGKIIRTAIEARAIGYAEGWRFEPKLKMDGEPSAGQVSDWCANCTPKPLPAKDTWKNRR